MKAGTFPRPKGEILDEIGHEDDCVCDRGAGRLRTGVRPRSDLRGEGGEYVCWDQPGGGERCVCEVDDRAEEEPGAEPGAEPAYEPQPQPWHPATVPILPQQVKIKVTR